MRFGSSATDDASRATSVREIRRCGPARGARHASISLREGEEARSGPGGPCRREASGLHSAFCGRMFTHRLTTTHTVRAQHVRHPQVSASLRNSIQVQWIKLLANDILYAMKLRNLFFLTVWKFEICSKNNICSLYFFL